jgi:hypothetical protein
MSEIASQLPTEPIVHERTRAEGLTDLVVSAPDGAEIARYTVNLRDHRAPDATHSPRIARWEDCRYGGMVCLNDNQFVGREWSTNRDPGLFAPARLDVAGWVATMKRAGMRYAVLTVRHTSGFLLWDSPTSGFDVAASPCGTDVVADFVQECRRQGIAPGIYYCLWGHEKSLLPHANARPVILAQLHELASRYGEIAVFWIDMQLWAPADLPAQDIYDLLRNLQPDTVVLFNQHVQDGTKIAYFPTDALNGELMVPPAEGHQAVRQFDGRSCYLPFEFEPVSQRRSVGFATPIGDVGVWFTNAAGQGFEESRPMPVEVLFEWIRQGFRRGAANVLLSLGPDPTGAMRPHDTAQREELGQRPREARLTA